MDSLDLLKGSGWYPGRHVDVSAARRALLHLGYRLHDAAIAVLEEFSGLTINGPEFSFEGHNGRLRSRRQLWIDGERSALELDDPVACEGYSELVCDTLVPVGAQHHVTVLIGEKGAVWGAYSGVYGFIAESFVTAVARILVPSSGEWSLDRSVPDGPATEELIRRRKLEEETSNKQRGWRRFWGRRM